VTGGALAGILDAISAAPDLRRGLCVDRWDLWDETDDPATIEATTRMCLRCPVLDRCRDWSSQFSNRHLSGVVAGVVRPWSPSSDRKAATA
jgi:hypothetical protein